MNGESGSSKSVSGLEISGTTIQMDCRQKRTIPYNNRIKTMKYQHHEVSFEIPYEWLIEARVVDFSPPQESYVPAVVGDEEIIFVNFTEFKPLVERTIKRGVFCDNHETGDTAKLRVMVTSKNSTPISPFGIIHGQNLR